MAKTILIVDDSASIRQVVGIALRGAGYDVIEGVDGADGLKKLDGRKINLIVSDVHMPNMDGITFVKELKKMPMYRFTPVIMLTTESQASKKLEGQAAGAKAWVVKALSAGADAGCRLEAGHAVTRPLRPVRLTEELTIQTAAENKAVIVAALGWGTDIEIDLGKVTEIDTAGIQLLLLAKREAVTSALSFACSPRRRPFWRFSKSSALTRTSRPSDVADTSSPAGEPTS